ncbi:MAG: hypothetical protein UHN88_00480 [Eubacterium sp.]|nr:hypothetical protein [Eubacterium sp.]
MSKASTPIQEAIKTWRKATIYRLICMFAWIGLIIPVAVLFYTGSWVAWPLVAVWIAVFILIVNSLQKLSWYCPHCGGELRKAVGPSFINRPDPTVRKCPHCGRKLTTWDETDK